LGERTRKVLTAGAVIGRTFSLDVLEAVVESSEEDVLTSLEEAERAQLVTVEAGARDLRYAFVHELIRTTLAGRRALAAGAFEETLDTFDRVIGLELADDDPLLAEALERRGNALVGLQRSEEAGSTLTQALALYTEQRNDAGIMRATVVLGASLVWRNRLADAAAVVDRGLAGLSEGAAAERAILLGIRGHCYGLLSDVEEAWDSIADATSLAEHLDNPPLLGSVLSLKAGVHRICCELAASSQAAATASPLLRPEAFDERANLLMNIAFARYWAGDFSAAVAILPELERLATRAGHHGALWYGDVVARSCDLMRSGSLRAFVTWLGDVATTHLEAASFFKRILMATAQLHTVHVEHALERLREIAVDPPHPLRGTVHSSLFAENAILDRQDQARAQIPLVESLLPVAGRRNIIDAWSALGAAVVGFAAIGDVERCRVLYPAARDYVETGLVCSFRCSACESSDCGRDHGPCGRFQRQSARALRDCRPADPRGAAADTAAGRSVLVRPRAGRRPTSRRTVSRPRDDRSRRIRFPHARNGHLRQSRRAVSELRVIGAARKLVDCLESISTGANADSARRQTTKSRRNTKYRTVIFVCFVVRG
jgi:tetratricopeptide (TPR) repeat protein